MGGSGSQKQTTELPKYAQPYSEAGIKGVFDYFLPGGNPAPYTGPNQSVAPLTPDQQIAFDASRKLAGDVGGMYAPYSPDKMNQYLDPYAKAAEQGLIADYQTAIAPNILSHAAQTGTLMSSGHQQATEDANSALSSGLADLRAKIYEPAWESAQNRGLQAAGGQVQSQLGANQALLGAGGQEQQHGQNVLDTAYNNLYRAWQWPQQAFSNAAGDFGGFLGNQATTKISGGSK